MSDLVAASSGEWLIAAFLVVTSVVALGAASREWRGTDGADPFRAPDWWPADMPLWRALIRAGPTGAVESLFVAGGFVFALIEGSALADALEIAFRVLVIATIALLVLVGLYNRPSPLVAPRLRRYPGVLAEWKGAVPNPTEGGTDGHASGGHHGDRDRDRARDRHQHRAG